MKNKYYVVWVGHTPGIYMSWQDTEKQVKGFSGAKFKGFPCKKTAEEAYLNQPHRQLSITPKHPTGRYLTVDAAYSHKTKICEWRGVLIDTLSKTSHEVFRSQEYIGGSANVGEFIAITDGIQYLQTQKEIIPIYSDSWNAQSWVKKGKDNSNVYMSPKLKERLKQANEALSNGLCNRDTIIKDWNTKSLGEIPADFGRK